MTHSFEYDQRTLAELAASDRELVEAARLAAGAAWAPLTNYRVGAAARLTDGRVVSAANEESAIGVLGVCAERNLLYRIPVGVRIEAMAIFSPTGAGECYPCGVCRQQMVEFERRQRTPMRVVMAGYDTATVVASARDLLPFTYLF
jgi:cytidine deaminase